MVDVKDENGETQEVQGPFFHNHGPCGLCRKPVVHAYPWWNGNPENSDSHPFHDECFWEWSK